MTVDRTRPNASPNPLPGSEVPVESMIAREIVSRALFLVVPVVGLSWQLRGSQGALAAAIGLAIVVVNFWLSGKLLSSAMRISLTMYHAAALVGFLVRMGLIAVTMLIVVRFIEIDRLAFGVSAVVCYIVLITMEAISVMRSKERKLDWVS